VRILQKPETARALMAASPRSSGRRMRGADHRAGIIPGGMEMMD